MSCIILEHYKLVEQSVSHPHGMLGTTNSLSLHNTPEVFLPQHATIYEQNKSENDTERSCLKNILLRVAIGGIVSTQYHSVVLMGYFDFLPQIQLLI